MKIIYLYVLKEMAEWEIGYILQGISMEAQLKGGKKEFEVKTIGFKNEPVRTIGGLTIIPDYSIEELEEANIGALLLPGSTTWNVEENQAILKKAVQLLEKNVVVGAICGATLALADLGVLNNYKHTSNSLEYLKYLSKEYTGESLYNQANAIEDKGLITASSAGGLDWARDILSTIQVYKPEIINSWYNYYLTGNPEFYSELLDQC
ncbi:MAG: DJ-1/PfpI family protein [Clostridium sp.]